MLTELLTLGILFSAVVNAVFVAKSLTSWILFSNSVSFASSSNYNFYKLQLEILFSNSVSSVLSLFFNTKSLVSILFTLATNLSCTSFLTTSFFTTLLTLL